MSVVTRLITVLAVVFLFSFGSNAKNLKIDAFYGEFQGSGVSENRDSIYFGVTVRDFGVVIRPVDQGFEVEWTTVIRRGGNPNKPKIRQKTQKFIFQPTAQKNIFRSPESPDYMSGQPFSWARINRNTLHIYLLSINPKGIYSMQTYARTLTPMGMDFVFTRLRDGEPVRSIKGKLVKHKK